MAVDKNRMSASQVAQARKSAQVDTLAGQIERRAGSPATREYYFHPRRRWRFDIAYPDVKVAIEYEGGTWGAAKSRHTTGSGYAKDVEKYNAAALLGWAVIRCTADMLKDESAADVAARLIRERRES